MVGVGEVKTSQGNGAGRYTQGKTDNKDEKKRIKETKD